MSHVIVKDRGIFYQPQATYLRKRENSVMLNDATEPWTNFHAEFFITASKGFEQMQLAFMRVINRLYRAQPSSIYWSIIEKNVDDLICIVEWSSRSIPICVEWWSANYQLATLFSKSDTEPKVWKYSNYVGST